jgi:hypothetical protein
MATKGKAIAPREDPVTLQLPRHAARYLSQMCERERRLLNNLKVVNELSGHNLGLEAAFDALSEIEQAL